MSGGINSPPGSSWHSAAESLGTSSGAELLPWRQATAYSKPMNPVPNYILVSRFQRLYQSILSPILQPLVPNIQSPVLGSRFRDRLFFPVPPHLIHLIPFGIAFLALESGISFHIIQSQHPHIVIGCLLSFKILYSGRYFSHTQRS
jgi:hypothetical protein